MRIAFKMMTGRALDNLSASSERLIKAQAAASSGKKINRPSDDVTGTGRVLRLHSAISSIEQFQRNNSIVKSQLTMTASALNSVVSALQSTRNYAVTAANTALTEESRAAIASQLDRVMDTLVAAANTQFSGKYLFSGSRTDVPAVVASTAGPEPYVFQGDSAELAIQIAPGTKMAANTSANLVFNMGSVADPSAGDVFSTIKALKQDILSGNVQAVSGRIEEIDANLNNAVSIRSQVGGRLDRLESTTNMLLDLKLLMSDLLSDTEDVDLAEAILSLRTQENIYQAAVATAGRVLDISLVNYFK